MIPAVPRGTAGPTQAVVVIMHWDEEASWVGDEFRWFGI